MTSDSVSEDLPYLPSATCPFCAGLAVRSCHVCGGQRVVSTMGKVRDACAAVWAKDGCHCDACAALAVYAPRVEVMEPCEEPMVVRRRRLAATRRCRWCGEVFVVPFPTSTAQCCSRVCGQRWRRGAERARAS